MQKSLLENVVTRRKSSHTYETTLKSGLFFRDILRETSVANDSMVHENLCKTRCLQEVGYDLQRPRKNISKTPLLSIQISPCTSARSSHPAGIAYHDARHSTLAPRSPSSLLMRVGTSKVLVAASSFRPPSSISCLRRAATPDSS